MALAIKLALFAWGVYAFPFKQNPHETRWTIWSRWDATSYIHIADGFYSSQGLTKDQHEFLSHFPPFHPVVIRLAKAVLPCSTMMCGLIVSWIAGLAAAYFLALLAWHEFQDGGVALLAVLLFHLYPVSYFLITPYSESLYFLLALVSFYFLRIRPQYLLSATSIGLSVFTRLLGITLLPVLGLRIWIDVRQGKSRLRSFALLSIPVLAAFAYLLINRVVYGSAFFFFHHAYIDPQMLHRPNVPLWETVTGLWRFAQLSLDGIWDPFFMQTLGWGSLFTLLVGIVTAWGAARKLVPWEYSVYSACYILFYSSFHWGLSNARYSYGAFPIFFALARGLPRPLLWQWIVISAGFLLFFTKRYVSGGWAF